MQVPTHLLAPVSEEYGARPSLTMMRDEVAQRKRLAQQWQQSLLQLEGKVEQALANTPAVADEQL